MSQDRHTVVITYTAINLTNKKFYVGSTVNFEGRKKSHLKEDRNYPFQNSLRSDPENFYWVVSEDDGLDDRSEEQYYLDFYHGTVWCYNLNPKASVPPSALGTGGPTHHLYGKEWDPGVIARRTAHCAGETNPAYGKRWWNDKEGNYELAVECPGESWVLGGRGHEPGKFSGEKNPMYGKTGELSPCHGMRWFNNGIEIRKSHECPGEGWTEGRGQVYNNGVENKFSLEHPGEGWVRGRLARVK
jgi:hypothetical protein